MLNPSMSGTCEIIDHRGHHLEQRLQRYLIVFDPPCTTLIHGEIIAPEQKKKRELTAISGKKNEARKKGDKKGRRPRPKLSALRYGHGTLHRLQRSAGAFSDLLVHAPTINASTP